MTCSPVKWILKRQSPKTAEKLYPRLVNDFLIRLYEELLGRNKIQPIVGGCVAGVYEAMIREGYEKIRILPNAVYPDKPKYK